MSQSFDPRGQCLGKVRYRQRRWAKGAIQQMRARGRATAGLSAYLCPHCGFFHIGNRPPGTAFDDTARSA